MLAAEFSLLDETPTPPPPKKKKAGHGGAAVAGGGGAGVAPERDDIHVPDHVTPELERPALGDATPARRRLPKMLARFMGRGVAGFVTTRLAGDFGKRHLGQHGEEIGSVGALLTTIVLSEDDPDRLSAVLGSAAATMEMLHRKHADTAEADTKVTYSRDVGQFVTKSRELDVPISVSLKAIKKDGAPVMWFRYAIVFSIDGVREVWFYQELRRFVDGSLDTTGTLLEQLTPTKK